MHLGAKNTDAKYILGEAPLGESVMKRILGCLQIIDLANACNAKSQITKLAKHSRDILIVLLHYKTLVWQYLEYAVQFWPPMLRKEVGYRRSSEKGNKINKGYGGP